MKNETKMSQNGALLMEKWILGLFCCMRGSKKCPWISLKASNKEINSK